MDLPMPVLIHNETLGFKGTAGSLVRVSDEGFYEVDCRFGENLHRVFLPIGQTVLICKEPELITEAQFEIER